MLIKLNISEQSKFPCNIYSNADILKGETPILIQSKEFDINNLAYKDNELICETFATEQQLQSKGIIYTIVPEIEYGFLQIVTKTETYGEYLSYEEIKEIL